MAVLTSLACRQSIQQRCWRWWLRSRGWRLSAKDEVMAVASQSQGTPGLCENLGRCSSMGQTKSKGAKVQLKGVVRPPKAANAHSYSGSEISAGSGNVRLYDRTRHIGA